MTSSRISSSTVARERSSISSALCGWSATSAPPRAARTQVLGHPAQRARQLRPPGAVAPAAARDPSRRGAASRAARLRLRLVVEHQVAGVDRSDPVHHRVVGLRDERPAAALEAVEQDDLPQRPAAVEPVRPVVAEPLAQLRFAARAPGSVACRTCAARSKRSSSSQAGQLSPPVRGSESLRR